MSPLTVDACIRSCIFLATVKNWKDTVMHKSSDLSKRTMAEALHFFLCKSDLESSADQVH